MTLTPLTTSTLDHPGVQHGFFTRQGGTSKGIYASLNCGPGSNDNPEHITQNRNYVRDHLNAQATLITAHQIHSNHVITITEDSPYQPGMQGDALVTNQPEYVLGILTADCVPVLFVDPEARIIGAAHAGWKGAFSGIVENTINAMVALGADKNRINAAIGPCIAQESYEVDMAFYQRFIESNSENQRYFVPSEKTDHYQFDLPAYVENCLSESNIGAYERLTHDTYTLTDQFFSWRRSFHQGLTDYGRQISAITLK